jgi:hypothetical protein
MAIGTTTLLGLLALGFFILFLGGTWWWLGIATIMLSLAMALGGEQSPVMVPRPAMAQARPMMSQGKPAKKKEIWGSVNDPMHFKPTMPPDGIADIGSIGPEKGSPEYDLTGGIASVGKRTGTFSFYATGPQDKENPMARVRVKDDLRLNMPFMDEQNPVDGVKVFTNLITSHFRTSKPILKTKCLEPTFETVKTGFDDWAKE